MFHTLIARLRQRHELRRSIGGLLRRADNHLLDDIGLSRDELALLIAGSSAPLGRSAVLTAASVFA